MGPGHLPPILKQVDKTGFPLQIDERFRSALVWRKKTKALSQGRAETSEIISDFCKTRFWVENKKQQKSWDLPGDPVV